MTNYWSQSNSSPRWVWRVRINENWPNFNIRRMKVTQNWTDSNIRWMKVTQNWANVSKSEMSRSFKSGSISSDELEVSSSFKSRSSSSALTSNLANVQECRTSTIEINIWVILEYGRTGRFSVSKRRNSVAVRPFSGSIYLSNSIEVLTPEG